MGTPLLVIFLSNLPKLSYPILLISNHPGNSAGSTLSFRRATQWDIFTSSQFINADGVLEPLRLPGYTHSGEVYKTQLAGGQPGHGSITAGGTRIDITVPNTLAGLRILGFTPAGDFYAVVEEMVSTPIVKVDQTVRLYGTTGDLRGLARVPIAEQYAYVQNGLAVGPDGAVYALLTRQDHVQVVRLSFSAELEAILPTPVQ